MKKNQKDIRRVAPSFAFSNATQFNTYLFYCHMAWFIWNTTFLPSAFNLLLQGFIQPPATRIYSALARLECWNADSAPCRDKWDEELAEA